MLASITPDEIIERIISKLPDGMDDDEKREAAREINELAMLLCEMETTC